MPPIMVNLYIIFGGCIIFNLSLKSSVSNRVINIVVAIPATSQTAMIPSMIQKKSNFNLFEIWYANDNLKCMIRLNFLYHFRILLLTRSIIQFVFISKTHTKLRGRKLKVSKIIIGIGNNKNTPNGLGDINNNKCCWKRRKK